MQDFVEQQNRYRSQLAARVELVPFPFVERFEFLKQTMKLL